MALKVHYTIGEEVGALSLVIFLSAVGGTILGTLNNGFTFPNAWPFKGLVLKPLFNKIHVPPLMMMIIMGCIVRNFFG